MFTAAHHHWTTESLINLAKAGMFKLSSDLDYSEPWTILEMSRLVESLIIGLPVGEMTIVGNKGNAAVVVDGMRRIEAICRFVGTPVPWDDDGSDNGFTLTGMEFDASLEGLDYRKLAANLDLRTAFENSSIQVIKIVPIPAIDLSLIRQRANFRPQREPSSPQPRR